MNDPGSSGVFDEVELSSPTTGREALVVIGGVEPASSTCPTATLP